MSELFASLIGAQLSSPSATQLLNSFADREAEKLDIAPDENVPVEFYIRSYKTGVQLRHSMHGRIEVIFVYCLPAEGFSPFRGTILGTLHANSSLQDVLQEMGPPALRLPARTDPILGGFGEALRYKLSAYLVHFQFDHAGSLARVTFMAPEEIDSCPRVQ